MIKIDNLLIGISFVSVLVVSLYIGVYYKTDTYIENEKEVYRAIAHKNITRLHKVPILLYHNINGKGPYSLPFDKLKNQFTQLQNNGIKVISLQQLESHIDEHNPFGEKVISITFDDGYYSMYTMLMPMARSMSYPVTLFVYIDAIAMGGTKNLTWKKLQIMQNNNIDIQCHSHSHADLVKLYNQGTLESRYALYREIYLSKKILELYLDKTIDYFAFPYGRYSIELTELCKDAGYKRVFSTDYGPNIVTRDNFCLRRHHVKSNYSDEKVLSLAW
ncbi:MAG TPA: polysaccharide deacetylase family protein [Spirochaetota bacterium]|nr:polysaccharide deacetylase family protein [Spirochaetota bacterium]